MRTLWKILVPLALVLPLGAYLAGALVTSVADDPAPRRTIVIHRSAPPSTAPQESRATRPRHAAPTQAPAGAPTTAGAARTGEAADDGPPEVVTPSPEDLADDHGRDEHADDRGEDDGGGGDDGGGDDG